jgi:hypothetical protein
VLLVGVAACLLWGCGSAPATAHAGNPAQIEYLLVLNAHGKPRTSFTPGAGVGFRAEVYAVTRSLGGVRSAWTVRGAGKTVRAWSKSGGFSGPSRGNLFRLTQTMRLPSDIRAGTYTVAVSLSVQGRHLARSARFYVRG